MSDFTNPLGDRLGDKLPVCNTEDPGQLEAWYGNFGFVDHWRSVVLANCREIVRATFAAKNEKISEARIDDLARVNNAYVDFLITHLNGRRIREEQVRQMTGAV